jgi:hypothetical protein
MQCTGRRYLLLGLSEAGNLVQRQSLADYLQNYQLYISRRKVMPVNTGPSLGVLCTGTLISVACASAAQAMCTLLARWASGQLTIYQKLNDVLCFE